MLEKPNVADEKIVACLRDEYGLQVTRLEILALGADLNTAVYRADTNENTAYFVKLRGGIFEPSSITLPKFLAEQGIAQIIPPLATKSNALWTNLQAFKVIVYPFVEGQNGYKIKLSERQWAEFGCALKCIHTTTIPTDLIRIQRETFTPHWRERVKAYTQRVENESFNEPIARDLAAFIRSKRREILESVSRTQQLAETLVAESLDFVLCHYDIHAGNLMIDRNGALYIVDWDNPILAPKERDLMFIGGAQGFQGYAPQQEEDLFYRGYGPTRIHQSALAYYRYERIIEDFAVECEQVFGTTEKDRDRAQAVVWFKSNFLPGETLEMAYRADTQKLSNKPI